MAALLEGSGGLGVAADPARTGRIDVGDPVVFAAERVRAGSHGHADALSFALGGGLHVGVAVTDAEAFLDASSPRVM